ncbi:MAG: amidase [Acidobacteria bacterium]|nr:amidase [Acidobacteriota bacterium]
MTQHQPRNKPSRREFLALTAGAIAVTACENLVIGQASPIDGTNDGLTGLTLREASNLIRKKGALSVDLTQACLARIDKYQGMLNAFITVTPEKALTQAREMDSETRSGKWRGPLHGIPIALKDNIDTAGVRTTAASALFADRIPTEDAEVVRKLRAAGAVILGKLNMDEFAAGGTSTTTYFGPVHNPWALDRNAGGSSGGSGAAAASELCFGALGTDTGGSIRTPSSYCSIVGFKPTYGRVSNRGVIPLTLTLDHVGPMCRTVEDTAIMLQVIAGYDPEDTASTDVPVPDFVAGMKVPVSSLRLGIPRAQFYDMLHADVATAINEALEVLRKLTAGVREIAIPAVMNIPILGGAETYAYHAQWFTRTPNLYQAPLRRRLEQAAKMSAADYVLARREIDRLRREIKGVFNEVDLLITPTVKIQPRTIEEAIKRAESEKPLPPELGNTGPFNIFGLPTISVPCGFTKLGLPVGLQISGPHFQETRVLALAHTYEQATGWHKRRPSLKPGTDSK